MNTIEVLNILKFYLKNRFFGVFPLDLVPPITKYPTALIVNLDTSNKPGSHWVALYFDIDGHCDYFDSYGYEPTELKQYIKDNSGTYTYNNVQIQTCLMTSCGHMCIYFLVWRAKGISFKNIVLSMYHTEIYENFKNL